MSVQHMTIILFCLFAGLMAATTTIVAPNNPPPKSNNFLAIQWSYKNVAIVGAAILAAGVALGAAMVFFVPTVAYRLCYFMGGCQNTMDAYVDSLIGIGNDLGAARNVRSRNRRSVEYLEPILVTLAQAYEKYSEEGEKKNFKTPTSFTE